jgi:hypothetical protein
MAEEEAAMAAVNTTTEKGKEQIDDILEEENFNFQDLLGQELTGAEKEELKKYAISCGLKGKCALGPFLSILVIECQRKCFCVDLCNEVDKVKIMSKRYVSRLSTLFYGLMYCV